MSDRIRTGVIALAAGLLVCFSMPPWGIWPLAPAGIALWLHLLDGAPLGRRVGIGWIVGIGWFGPSTLWMYGLTAAGYPFGVVFGWGPMVAFTSAVVPPDRRRFLVLPAAIVGYEWFHSHAPFGGAPLSMLGMSQVGTPLLGIARLGGVLLVGAAVSALGVALYLAAKGRWRAPVAAVCAVIALAIVGSLWPLGDPVGTVTIAAVQGGGPQGTRFASGQEPQVFNRHVEATRTISDDAPVDLVVWPENAINVDGNFADHPWREVIAAEAARIGVPIVVGVVDDGPTDDSFHNYLLVVEPDGELSDRFDKERRVPFGEYTPVRWLFEPVAAGALPPRDQIPGEGVAVIDTPGGPMAVVVSWEVFFSRRVREGVRAGGEVVLNPTNGSSYTLTQVQTQQVAASQLRAVESGRWVVQTSPTGFSAFIDPDGRVYQRTGVSEQAVLERTIDRYDSTMPAQALGAMPALLLAAAAVAVAQLRLRDSELDEERDRAVVDD
ncbi:MAG: apolipoprotein N-acyltransferase [Actinomycetia bacterium]|nr:apolipoprotein N-acyltransferase [Actinomycetes bacterium]